MRTEKPELYPQLISKEKRPKELGFFKYETASDGTIHIFDTLSNDELSVADMGVAERKEFFTDLFEYLESELPQGYKMVWGADELKYVPSDYTEGENTAIALIRYTHSALNGIKINWVGSKVPNGAKFILAFVLKQFPETEYIIGELASSNMEIYDLAKKSGMDDSRALKQTPAYKYRAALGFNGIDTKAEQYGHGGIRVLVSVPLKKTKGVHE